MNSDCTKQKKIHKARSQTPEQKHEKQNIHHITSIENERITLGICAMEKKTQSKEMQEILQRINTSIIKIVIFSEKCILRDEVEDWPIVNALICFYSQGFPLYKASDYVKLREPFLINDVKKQQYLWDRQIIYKLLKENNIPVPKHYFAIRNIKSNIIKDYFERELEEQSQYAKKKQNQLPQSTTVNNNNTHSLSPQKNENKGDISEVLEFLNQESLHQKDSSQSQEEKKKSLKNQSSQRQSLKKSRTKTYDKYSFQLLGITHTKLTIIKQIDDDLFIGDDFQIKKPFVEKPMDGENHKINIYYHSNIGGGCKKLFRKVGNQSSTFEQNTNQIREDANYIYEEFIQTNGFDVKVYTIGEFYAHAEARKSPTLDGKVLRTQEGKEVRYPICLTPEEKLIATKIVNVFGQSVCGFDLLRSEGKSYVCDVNGWSFVKGNSKYYDDCATIITQMIVKQLKPGLLTNLSLRSLQQTQKNSFRPDINAATHNSPWELRSIVAIFRHGDRTPKQKMKLKSQHPLIIEFFQDVKDLKKEIKLKHPQQLEKMLEVTREWIKQIEQNNTYDFDDNILTKLYQLKSVLERGGQFEGINRKIQLRVLNFGKIENKIIVKEVLLIVKWGGELTQLGYKQALDKGADFRNQMYPTDKEGLLRLHSTYRHDLKTYSSDEGRCQSTAASFLKGFLDYEGEITPILASMVNKNTYAQQLLDCQYNTFPSSTEIYEKLTSFLNSEQDLLTNFQNAYPTVSKNEIFKELLHSIGNPKAKCQYLYKCIGELIKNVKQYLNFQYKDYYIRPQDMCQQQAKEELILFFKRWYKLYVDFYQIDENKFNISKIPDIFDSIKYDLIHNQTCIKFFNSQEYQFYTTSKQLTQFMVPLEFGINTDEKLFVCQKVVMPLCEKISEDLLWWKLPLFKFEEDYWKYRFGDTFFQSINSPWRHIRTRLYFTSASHLYSLFNVLNYGFEQMLIESPEQSKKLQNIMLLQYMSNIIIKLYENLNAPPNDPQRFKLHLSICEGIQFDQQKNQTYMGEEIHINQKLRMDQLETFLQHIIKMS